MPEVCKEAQWLAAVLMLNDEAFAREMTSLIWDKNAIENLLSQGVISKKTYYERLHTLNERINLFVEAKLLTWKWILWNLWDIATAKIIKQMFDSSYAIERARRTLESMIEADPTERRSIALLLSDGDEKNADAIVNKFNEAMARYVIAKDTIRAKHWINQKLSDLLHKTTDNLTNKAAKMWVYDTLTSEKNVDDIVSSDKPMNANMTKPQQPSLFKRDIPWMEQYDNISQKEARDIVYQYFDNDEVTIIFADNLMTPEGQAALGAYRERMIQFVKNPKRFVPEHEVVHAYIDLFLTQEEKANLVANALKYHSQDIADYAKLHWLSMDEAVEEYIADWFVSYVKKKQSFTWTIQSFFEDLWYRVKKIFWREDKVRNLYKDIEARKRPISIQPSDWTTRYRWEVTYSKWYVDNTWKEISDQMWDFMKKSKMRDSDWNLIHAYRWRDDVTPSQALWRSPDYGTHDYWDHTALFFTSDRELWTIYWTWRPATWKRIRNLEDAREEINARAMNEEFFQVDQIGDNKYTITIKADYLWRKEWEVIFEWDIQALDRFLIDEQNEITALTEPRLYETYLYAENPLIVDAWWKNWNEIDFNWEITSTDNIVRYAWDNWYDWVIIRNVKEMRDRSPVDDYVVFWQDQVKGVDNLSPTSDSNRRFKRDPNTITAYKIWKDPALKAEYDNRINIVKLIQWLAKEDLDYVKWAYGMFTERNWLFWEAKIIDIVDEWVKDRIISIAETYLWKWELNKVTVSELRNKIQETIEYYRKAWLQKNVIASMNESRVRWNGSIEVKEEIIIDDTATKKASKQTWREIVSSIIRNDLQTEEAPVVTKATQADPMNRVDLPSDAEVILKDAIKKDLDQVKRWEAPSNVASADNTWKEFSELSEDTKDRQRALNNYLIGKIYLWEWDDVLESSLKWLNGNNLKDYWPLTLAQIAKITDLWQLEQIVYSHIWDIINDISIRSALKEKQFELRTTVAWATTEEQWKLLSQAWSVSNTATFLEAWGSYTSVTMYDRAWRALRWVFDFDSSINNRDLYDQFVTAVRNFSSRRVNTTQKVGGIDMSANDLVKWIYAMSRDDIAKAVATADNADPIDQIKVAAKRLFDIGSVEDAQKAQRRINDLFNSITPQDLEDADITKLAYSTTSAVNIEWNIDDTNAVFYNYRDWMYAWDPQTSYWEFFDELAKQNSLVIDKESHMNEVFKISDIPADVKYIIVNDFNRWDDKELMDFIYSFPEDRRPQVVYPKWWMMANYYVENWKLKFKTTNWTLYNEITRNASVQTLWAFAQNIEQITEESIKDLEDKALEYFRTMMWLNMDWAPVNKAEYKEWIIANLRVMTWLPISAEMDAYTPGSTWKMASDIIRYQLWATGRYTKVIKNIDDTVASIESMFSSDRDTFYNSIKEIVGWNDDVMEKNAEALKQAFINYSIAPDIQSKIQAKWTMLALANWWEASAINVDTFTNAIREDNIVWVLGPIIYWQRELSPSEEQAIISLWEDILNAYVFDFWANMISRWYSMPLISPASSIRKFIRWESIIEDDFTQAFIKKNWIEQNSALINELFDSSMPSSLDFEMIDASNIISPSVVPTNIVVDEVDNVIIPTTYNQLSAIIEKWKISRWWWVTFEEEDIVRWILNNYYNEVERQINAWTMTPTIAQRLKLQAWWALDMVEQDLMIAKYDSFLTMEQRNGLMWWKYKLRIATTKDELASVERWNQEVINWYRTRLNEMWKEWIKTYNNLDKAKEDLINNWKVMTVVNWRTVTVNVHDLLIQEVNTLPDWLKWIFENFKQLTVNDIRKIPYKQAYSIIKAIDLAKNASARWNLYTRLMYKQNPQLAKKQFFKNFILNDDWVPVWLQNNAAKLVDASISDWVDTTIKSNIVLDVSQVMKKKWKINEDELTDIINKNLSDYKDNDLLFNHYKNMFMAYTYLTDIPKDIKNTINNMLDAQLKEIRQELKWLDWDFYDWLLNTRIILIDWSELTLWDVLKWDIDSYKWNLFVEKWSDWVYRSINMKEFTSNELWLTKSQVIDYSDSMYSMLNQLDQVNDVERRLNTQVLNDARKILSKYTTTKRLIDADYLVGWQNDTVKNLIKSNAFSWWWKLWWDNDMISKLWGKATWRTFFNKEDWETIRSYYYWYYSQDLSTLERMRVDNDLQRTALEMAKYFKRIENTLGSADWVVWTSINTSLNRAFWRLGTIVLNVSTDRQVHDLMNAIGNNQILKFFKFANEWDWAYFDLFSSLKQERQYLTWIEYIRRLDEDNLNRFNELFNSDFSMNEYKIIMQALWWYNLWSPARMFFKSIARWVNGSSVLARAIMSYPFQLLTIAPQSIAYNFKANAYKKALWIEDMDAITRIREWNNVLTSEFIELNPKWATKNTIKNYFAKYTWKDVDDLMVDQKVDMSDWLMELFWKSYSQLENKFSWDNFISVFDATRDNANNIIDALMAQKFKNLAFVKALKTNNVLTFANVNMFDNFMKDVTIPQDLKDRVMDAINIYSWRIFKDMLWTWFTWLDKVYWANVFQDILVALMNTINFRWAWWMNMWRQTWEKIWTVWKLITNIWDRDTIEQWVDYILRTPEFSNLSQAMFNDLVWMWKLARFSDNGRWPDDDSEADLMDYCEWILSNIDIVSQQWQWIMSFWLARPFIAQWEAILEHQAHPDMYWDAWWLWAFIQTFVSNVWRNWKPRRFMIDALRVWQRDWMWAAWDYVADNFYTLSAWTLRYMLEEWYNKYGSNTPLVYEVGWIPSFLAWEQWEGSDTAYMYKMRQAQFSDYMSHMIKWDEWYSVKWMWTQLKSLSQLLTSWREIIRWAMQLATWDDKRASPKAVYDLADLDEAYEDLPEWQEWRKNWFIMPKHEPWYWSYYDSIIYAFTESSAPGWANFYKWIANFLESWHINWKSEWDYWDAELEELYTRIEEREPGALKRFVSDEKLMAQVMEDTKASIQTSLSFMMDKLKAFEWDPEYQKYLTLVYKWVLSNVMYDELQDFADRKQADYRARWLIWPKEKISPTKIKKIPDLYKEFKENFVDSHWDEIIVADTEAVDEAMFNFLANKVKDTSDKYFTKKTYKDSDWNEYDKYYLKWNLRSQVEQLIDFEKAMRQWEWERAVVQWTMITKTFNYDKNVEPEVASYIFNRIASAESLTNKQKLEAMTEFAANNLDAFAWDSPLKEQYPEVYETAKWHYNDIVYQANLELIQRANDYALSLESDKEKSSKSGWLAGKALKVSQWLVDIMKWLQSSGSSTTRRAASKTNTWLKAPIIDATKITSDYTRTPQIDFNVTFKGWAYKPKTNLWWAKASAKPVKVKKTKVKEKDIEAI